MNNQSEECCPLFDVDKWDKKTFKWEDKLFIKETMPTLFHIPFPSMIGKKLMRMHSMAVETGATIPDKTDALILFRDPSAFKSELYYAVTKEVANAVNVKLSGTFVARVFDGPFSNMPKFFKEMDVYLKECGHTAKDYYVHYAYCPQCAKKYGHNYIIIFAQV